MLVTIITEFYIEGSILVIWRDLMEFDLFKVTVKAAIVINPDAVLKEYLQHNSINYVSITTDTG